MPVIHHTFVADSPCSERGETASVSEFGMPIREAVLILYVLWSCILPDRD